AIDGRPLDADTNPYEVLRHADMGHVELMVSETADLDDAEAVVIRPIRSEDDLLYWGWTEANRQKVAAATDGRVGYLHIPDMGAAGIREWIKHFYAQIDKEGLVIDVRSNGGGNISPMLLERLERRLSMVDFERHNDVTESVPNRTFIGHLVCLINETTASDGDQFAWVFGQKGLGPLIGKRSWGGVVGIYGSSSLVDGGGVSIPEAGSGGPDGEWIIEGYGVDPDVEIDNDPTSLAAGRDPQLEKAIDMIFESVQDDPRRLPPRPAPPVKTEEALR
ncbi:MAG: S41 family peptidase, partial [Acidobacteriota bacterium]